MQGQLRRQSEDEEAKEKNRYGVLREFGSLIVASATSMSLESTLTKRTDDLRRDVSEREANPSHPVLHLPPSPLFPAAEDVQQPISPAGSPAESTEHRSRRDCVSRMLPIASTSSKSSKGAVEHMSLKLLHQKTAAFHRPLKIVKRRIPPQRRSSSTRNCHRSGDVPDEEARLLRARSPNPPHRYGTSHLSYESTGSERDTPSNCRSNHSIARDKTQSMGTLEPSMKMHRRHRVHPESAAFSDSTIPFVVTEQRESAYDTRKQEETELNRFNAPPTSHSSQRTLLLGSISTNHDKKIYVKRENSIGTPADRKSVVQDRSPLPFNDSTDLDITYSIDGTSRTVSTIELPLLRARTFDCELPESGIRLDTSISTTDVEFDIHKVSSEVVSVGISREDLKKSRCTSTGLLDSMEFRLANPLEVLAITTSGRIMAGRALESWLDQNECSGLSTSLAGSAGRNLHHSSSVGKLCSKKSNGSRRDISSNIQLTDDADEETNDTERKSLIHLLAHQKAKKTSSSSTQNSETSHPVSSVRGYVCNVPVVTRPANQAFGDCSQERSKSLKSLHTKIENVSSAIGECDFSLNPVSTYVYHGHEMRKGGLYKVTGRQRASRSRVPTELYQNSKRSFSFDLLAGCSKPANLPEPRSLELSSPAMSRVQDGRHLLKVLKATGASGSCPLPKSLMSPQEERRSSPSPENACRMISSTFTLKPTSSATPLREPPAVEPQQPLGRIILLKRKMVIYPCVGLTALTLILALGTMFSYSINGAKLPHNHTIYSQKVLVIGKNESTLSQDAPKEDFDTCSTLACKRDGTYLKGLLSWDLDPCDNFYRFVCGRWKSGSAIVGSELKGDSAVAVSDDLSHQLEQSVHTLLQKSSASEDIAPLKGLFYECMNTRQLDMDDWNPMLELLWLVNLEGFPFSSTPRNSTSIWKIAAKVLKMTGAEALVSVDAMTHPSKGDASVVSVGLPSMMAPKGGRELETTQFYNRTVFMCMTALKKQRNPSVYSSEVAEFASRLEELVYSETVLGGLPEHRVQQLKTQPELSMFLVEVFLNSDSTLYSGSHTDLLLQRPSFFDALINLVRNTEQYIIMNYLGVRLMIEVAAFAPSSGSILVHTLVEHQYGRPRPSLPRWKLCVRAIERALPDLFLHASRLAYKTHFAIDTVQRLLQSLRLELIRGLGKLALLDRESRSQAHMLLNKTRFRIFQPSWLSNKEKLERYVSALPRIIRGQSLRSFYSLRSHSFGEGLRRDVVDHWKGSAFDHDCSYDANVVYVPVLLFNFTLFNYDADQSLPLAHSGVRVTRCLLQLLLAGVSQSGSSTPSKRTWWPDMAGSFMAVAQLCFQQYGLPRLSSLKLLEYTAALMPAMNLYQEEKRIDVRLDTFQAYSTFHLFFVYYALSFCQELQTFNTTEVAPVNYLTNVPLWNNRLFQETFRCPVGSNMNPARKCVVWREPH